MEAVQVISINPVTLLAINQAIAAEIEDATLTKDQTQALQMKFGLMAPVLTPSEQYLIQKEERKRARVAA